MRSEAAADARPIVLLANGNLNGRVLRLVADGLRRAQERPVRLVTSTRLNSLTRWPEERDEPHLVEPRLVAWEEAERLVETAAAFVLPPFWNGSARRLIGRARRAGTPVVCVVADVGYGASKLETTDQSELPDRICVADPVSRQLLVRHGAPETLLRNVGSPYFDAVLASPPSPPLAAGPLRVGLLANPDGARERLADRDQVSPDGVLAAVELVLREHPGARLTIRLHPRQRPERIGDAFPPRPTAVLDPLPPVTTMTEFVHSHHLVVGSYSMGLMVARLLGRPAVSFQPPMADDGLRREVFAAWDVPVATDEASLAATIAERLHCPGPPLVAERLLYCPGHSLAAISRVIQEVLPG